VLGTWVNVKGKYSFRFSNYFYPALGQAKLGIVKNHGACSWVSITNLLYLVGNTQMIQKYGYIMTLMSINAHVSILLYPPQATGLLNPKRE